MMTIAICDDEKNDLKAAVKLFNLYYKESGQKIVCQTFQNAFEFLDTVEKGICYDVIFLDVMMPTMNGMDVAKEIRKYDTNVKIIFLTSSPEFAVQSYSVKAYFYQLKPLIKEAVFRLLDELCADLDTGAEQGMVVKSKKEIAYIEYNKLEFCEVIGKTLFFHLASGRVIETTGSMEELSKSILLKEAFLRPHRSYLVNMDYIQSFRQRVITMQSLAQIPLPREKYAQVKDAYLYYSFRREARQ